MAAPDGAQDAPVTIGVVGMNYWGPNLARNFDRLPGARLAWICDLDGEVLDRHRPAGGDDHLSLIHI